MLARKNVAECWEKVDTFRACLGGDARRCPQADGLADVQAPARTVQAKANEAEAASGFELQSVLRVAGLNLGGLDQWGAVELWGRTGWVAGVASIKVGRRLRTQDFQIQNFVQLL